MLRCGKDLGQFPEVLGRGGEQEFVIFGFAYAASSKEGGKELFAASASQTWREGGS